MPRYNWFIYCLFIVQNWVKNLILTTEQLLFLLAYVEPKDNFTQLYYYLSPIDFKYFTSIKGWFLHIIHNHNYKNYFKRLIFNTKGLNT
jgi:hypothetical protein